MSTGQRWTAGLAALAVVMATLTGPAQPAAAVAPVEAPELVAPTADGTVTGNPVLRWLAVPGAARYRVQVSASATFASTPAFNLDTVGLQATPTKDLPVGAIHWRVAAMDSGSGVGPWAQSQFVKEPASQPALTGPDDGATLAYPATTPVLRWSPLAAVKSYRVELDDAEDFIEPTSYTTSNTALALTTPLTLDKDYYWHVQGVSATDGVTTSYSETRRFRMTWPAQAGQPVLQSPVGGLAVDVTDVVFKWSAVPGARDYQIQVTPNGDFENNRTDERFVKGTQYSPAATYDNATYFWRVRARDTGSPTHEGPWSTVGEFKRSWLPRPELVSPRDGAAVATERFEWTPIARASHYEVQVATDANFSAVDTCITLHTTLTSMLTGGCQLKLAAGGRYHWRVRGVDMPTGRRGVFSDATDFSYVPQAPPSVTGPADGSVTTAPVLSWSPLPGYSRYRVTVIRTDTGAATTADTYGTTFTPPAALVTGKDYTWYVVGLGQNGELGIAPTAGNYRHFTFAAPATVDSLDPVSVGDVGAGMAVPALAWQPLAGAAYYKVFSGVAGSNLFTALSGATKLYQTGFTPTTALTSGSYEWYVQAYNPVHAAVGQSALSTFTITDLPFASYTAPQHCALPDCAAMPRTPELSWQPVPGAGFYRVHAALDVNFTNVVGSYTTQHPTLTPTESYPDNAAGQSYYWYVQPCRSATNCGPYQGPELPARARAFRKKSAPVVLAAPLSAATVTDVVSLSWQDYRETAATGAGAAQYRVQVATDRSFGQATIVDSAVVDQTSYQAWAKSYPDNVYYWRVQAIDGGGLDLTFSEPREFTKVSAAPVPVTTTQTTTGLPTLTWDAMAYLAGYSLEIYRGDDGTFPAASRVLNTTTKLSAFTPSTALPSGTYSWRLRKLNADGDPGPWSTAVATFVVEQTGPVLIAPVAGAELATSDLLFSWEPVVGASSYLFESAASTSFTSPVEKRPTVMTAWAAAAAYTDRVPYFWRVSVVDAANNVVVTSAPRLFTKDSTGPKVVSATPATALPVDGALTVTFNEAVNGVTPAAFALRAAGSAVSLPGTAAQVGPATATFRPRAPLIPGQYYDLTVGGDITDTYGNPINVGPPARVRVATSVESTSPAITQRWDVDPAANASGGTYMSSRRAGATAVFSFTGSTVSIRGHASRFGGNADVYLDGVRQGGITCYSGVETHQKLLFSRTGLANTAHTLTVRVLGTKPAASLGTAVDLDAFMASGATYQETSSAVRTGFARAVTAAATGGSYDTTPQDRDATGAEYRFSFRGTGFTWLATRTPTAGSALVYIDGVASGTVNQYARTAGYRYPVYRSPTLADKVHQVRLVATGVIPTGSRGTDVSVDAITTR